MLGSLKQEAKVRKRSARVKPQGCKQTAAKVTKRVETWRGIKLKPGRAPVQAKDVRPHLRSLIFTIRDI